MKTVKSNRFAFLLFWASVSAAAPDAIRAADGADSRPPPPPGPEAWAFRKELAEDPPPAFDAPTGTPWLENRISRCFFSPIKRPPFNRDELKDDIDYYPANYLERLRREGVNGLWLSLSLDDLDDAALAKLRRTVEKCAAHGIKVWAFGIEPKNRPRDHAFFRAHPDARGARAWTGNHVNCPSSPAMLAELTEKVSRMSLAVPGLAGMINIVSGERPTTCLSEASPLLDEPEISCPVCSKRRPWELYEAVAKAMADGLRRGNPHARLITWFYHSQPSAKRGKWVYECARHVPEGAEIQYNFESEPSACSWAGLVTAETTGCRFPARPLRSEPWPRPPAVPARRFRPKSRRHVRMNAQPFPTCRFRGFSTASSKECARRG